MLLLAIVIVSGGCARRCDGSKDVDGTGQGSAATATPPKNELVVQIDYEPPALVPLIHPDQWAHRIVAHQLFESLVRFDPRPPHALRGELATSWKVSADGLTYDFALRKGVRWHDGSSFDSADVLFTFQRVLDEKVRAVSTRATLQPFVARYEQVGSHGFRIVCKRRSPYFIKALADLVILPAKRLGDGDLNTHPLLRRPIGTGPYRFERWQSGQQISLRRYRGYWGKAAQIERLVFRVVRSPELALQLARRREIDFLPRLHGAQLERVRGDRALLKHFRLVQHVTPGTAFVLFNHQRKHFADARVRRALAMLLDVPTIVTQIMRGQARRIASLYWIDDPEHDASIEPIPFDPAGAEKLLAAAGWRDTDGDGLLDQQGKPFKLSFLVVASSKSTQRWATIYQQQLKKAGIALSIETIEWTAYLARIRKHDFDLGTLGMALAGPYTDLYLQLHSSQIDDGQNYSAYRNPQVDRLLEQIRQQLDDAKRKRLSHELQQLLAREVPLIPLFTLTEPGLLARRVEGVYRSPLWYQLRDFRIRGVPLGAGPSGDKRAQPGATR